MLIFHSKNKAGNLLLGSRPYYLSFIVYFPNAFSSSKWTSLKNAISHTANAASAAYCEIQYDRTAPIPKMSDQIKKAFL